MGTNEKEDLDKEIVENLDFLLNMDLLEEKKSWDLLLAEDLVEEITEDFFDSSAEKESK